MFEFLAEEYRQYPVAYLFGPLVPMAAWWAAFVKPVIDAWATATDDFG
jgi:hypothetical protein